MDEPSEQASTLMHQASIGISVEPNLTRQPAPERRRLGRLELVGIIVLLLAVVVTLQWLGGAFRAELSSYPDEASHYMSGVLVHDYVRAGFPEHPLAFATRFYLHYPYLAIGHWPPLFYLLEGGWMFLFGASRGATMLLMAVIATALLVMTYLQAQREFGRMLGLLATLVLASSPVVQKYAGMVMMDTLLAVLSLWAVLCFARFLDSVRWRDAMQFAGLASLALLTKGNAFFLALVPGIAILLSRRFYLLKRGTFWSPAVVVALLCLPWHLVTMHMMLPTFGDHLGLTFTQRAASFYGALLLRSLGAPLLALALAGLFTRVVRPCWNGGAGALWASLGSLLASLGLFYCIVPAGIEARYTIAAFPLFLIFAMAGAVDLARAWAFGTLRMPVRLFLILAVAVGFFFITAFTIPIKASFGFRAAAAELDPIRRPNASLILVSTETSVGEGIFVSELAMRGNRGRDVVLRASQMLADSNWGVTKYKLRYATSEELNRCLKASNVEYLVLDESSATGPFVHHRQLLEIVEQHPEDWRLAMNLRPGDGNVRVYRRASGEAGNAGTDPLCSIRTNLTGKNIAWPVQISLACSTESSAQPLACRSIP